MPDEPIIDAEVVPAEPVIPADTGYTPDGVPTFESVREKIETRYTTSIGSAELDAQTPEGRSIEEQYDARQRAAAERLAQIRESMGKSPDSAQ
ncbi:hypothetical protein [Mycobacterium sp. 236(2023)]|uniref:hypothetical protein n=1 Tax=Mycobacterium sp. 236(2023) TaxID=3038163 RepID=UPI0024158EEC|nr:hypothetical protein [Mycobacterium sp. 236(2023)]MDG4668757.1 hypothetical protein [Mycobacterium sp. 236(2023)]